MAVVFPSPPSATPPSLSSPTPFPFLRASSLLLLLAPTLPFGFVLLALFLSPAPLRPLGCSSSTVAVVIVVAAAAAAAILLVAAVVAFVAALVALLVDGVVLAAAGGVARLVDGVVRLSDGVVFADLVTVVSFVFVGDDSVSASSSVAASFSLRRCFRRFSALPSTSLEQIEKKTK